MARRHDGVVIRRQQLLFIAVFIGLFAVMAFAASRQQPELNGAWHTLTNVTMTHASGPDVGKGNLTSVDGNMNGIIDNAEFAQDSLKVGGLTPSATAISKGCVVADTASTIGCGTTGNSCTGYVALDLRIGGENICADGDGCFYRIIRYNAATGAPSNIYHASPYAFFQDASTSIWIDFDERTGTNGGGVTRFVNWRTSSGTQLLEAYDDQSGVEASVDQLSIRDLDSTRAFKFVFCD